MSANASVLVVHAGGRRCALPVDSVAEVCRPLPVEADTGPPGLVGVTRLRGRPVPVLDLAQLLGEAQTPTLWVRLRLKDRSVALAVESVEGLQQLEHIEALPPLLTGRERVVRALAALDGELVSVLDAARLVDA